MAEPADMILPLLREIQGDVAALRKEAGERLSALEAGQREIHLAVTTNWRPTSE